MESTEELRLKFPPKLDKTCRGSLLTYYLGYWRESSKVVTQTPHFKSSFSQQWWKANELLFDHAAMYLKVDFPNMFDCYQTIDEQLRPFGKCWSLAVLNIEGTCEFHADTKDWRNGLCCVIPFSKHDWKGGELSFPHLNIRVNGKSGDLIFFQSHLLEHGNLPVTEGNRNSLVLVSHNNLFNTI